MIKYILITVYWIKVFFIIENIHELNNSKNII